MFIAGESPTVIPWYANIVRRMQKKPVYTDLSELAQQYGSNFYYYNFIKPWLVVTDADVARKLLMDPNSHKPRQANSKFITWLLGENVVNANSHGMQRYVILNFF